MSSIQKNIEGKKITAKKGLSVGIIFSDYNAEIVEPMRKSCVDTLLESAVLKKDIHFCQVPGAFEIPFACQKMAKNKGFDVIIALGCIIRGDTPHFDYIASCCAMGIMDVSLKTDVPIVFGVLTTDNMAQARARINKGTEAALTALQMSNLNIS